jgi:cytochrome c biogenesis protein CcdA
MKHQPSFVSKLQKRMEDLKSFDLSSLNVAGWFLLSATIVLCLAATAMAVVASIVLDLQVSHWVRLLVAIVLTGATFGFFFLGRALLRMLGVSIYRRDRLAGGAGPQAPGEGD